jgi:hypothetical protein
VSQQTHSTFHDTTSLHQETKSAQIKKNKFGWQDLAPLLLSLAAAYMSVSLKQHNSITHTGRQLLTMLKHSISNRNLKLPQHAATPDKEQKQQKSIFSLLAGSDSLPRSGTTSSQFLMYNITA